MQLSRSPKLATRRFFTARYRCNIRLLKKDDNDAYQRVTNRTRLVGVRNAVEEDADEPLERVLVHRVDVGQIGDAEEEDLSVDGDWNVLTARYVDIPLSLLGDLHLRLPYRQFFTLQV